MQKLLRREEGGRSSPALRCRDRGRADRRDPHDPEQVAHRVAGLWAIIDHRDINLVRRQAGAEAARHVHQDIGEFAPEIAQDRQRHLMQEGRRHMHAQASLMAGLLPQDAVHHVFNPIEGFAHHR